MTSKRLELGLNLGRGVDYHAHLTSHGRDAGWSVTLFEGHVYAEPHGSARVRVDVGSLGRRNWRNIAMLAQETLGKYPSSRVRRPSLENKAICLGSNKN